MTLLTALLLIPLIALLCGVYVGGLETILQYLEYRKEHKQLQRELEEWYGKALSYSDYGKSAEYKGQAIAMCVVLNHELSEGDDKSA